MSLSLRKKQIIALCICCTLLAVAIFQNVRHKDPQDTSLQNPTDQSDVNVNQQPVSDAEEYFAGVRIERDSMRSSEEEKCLAVIADPSSTDEMKADANAEAESLQIASDQENAIETAIKARGYEDVFVLLDSDGNVDTTLKADPINQDEAMAIANIIMDNTAVSLDKIAVKCYS
ncbi:MAG: SpoIIIAH-like family protein [Clostridiales bacterium]|jgi:stage III sporulation protein AH|nr:SpoIIIAH-like family protein [Clostridiales bacterium]